MLVPNPYGAAVLALIADKQVKYHRSTGEAWFEPVPDQRKYLTKDVDELVRLGMVDLVLTWPFGGRLKLSKLGQSLVVFNRNRDPRNVILDEESDEEE